MTAVDHILAPVDGSSLAECVLPHTVSLARAFDARVTVLRVVERTSEREGNRIVDPLNWHIRKAEAEAYLDQVVGRLREVGLRVERVLLEGNAAERIVEFAHAEEVDLIALSSHGRSGLSQWNINSVVQKVIWRAFLPTLIVRAYRPITSDLTGLQYRRILVPLDGSQRAECVLPLARTIARFHMCPLLLTHVVSRPEVPRRVPLTEMESELVQKLVDRNREKGREYLRQLGSRFDSGVETRLVVGDSTAVSLHELVDHERIDLVALSAHGYSGEARWPYGSVALNFIAYGTTPLLIVQDLSREELERTQAQMAAEESKGH
jgi:nucleotide-binding universal stress UspA family protein